VRSSVEASGEHAEKTVEFLPTYAGVKAPPLFAQDLLDGPRVSILDRGEYAMDGGEGLGASEAGNVLISRSAGTRSPISRSSLSLN